MFLARARAFSNSDPSKLDLIIMLMRTEYKSSDRARFDLLELLGSKESLC